MIASNYQDVLDQLHAAGLEGRGLDDELIIGRMARCHVQGDREKRGWYSLHELRTASGDTLLVGSFGVWQGNENNAQKIELRKTELDPDQRASLRRRLAEDRKRADAVRRAESDRAARHAAAAWAKCAPTGESDYLTRKGVAAHGIRFSPSGAIAIPMLDTAGRIHGLQIIRGRKGKQTSELEKEFWPRGLAKKGHFHLIGVPDWIVLVAEGYATGASLHEATGYPVAIAFDAGNLQPVAAALRKRYKRARILICADDDSLQKCHACNARVLLAVDPKTCPHCGEDHRAGNAGITAASTAALEVDGAWVAPCFADEAARRAKFLDKGTKPTDFNDLHHAEGLHVVRTQVESRLGELGWHPRNAAARQTTPPGEGEAPLRAIETLDELLERYAIVYGQRSTVFDRQEHQLVAMADMRDVAGRALHRTWAEHPDRTIVRAREVGFDPAGNDPAIKCNLWSGWPTIAKSGSCEKLLELLRYMCSAEGEPNALYQWVLAWIAYPIQHPGAKLKTTLVLHGPQGTGKNLFFETVMAIYGHYGRVIDQTALEDKFNDWASRKLFLIADEVVARSDLYHVKNKLKAFITGDWIRINPKNMAAYDERNHVNMVFLSNESMPVVLDEDDRRHAVIWTPDKLDEAFYHAVIAEIDAGGVAALHDYLLHHDCGAFNPGTPPPNTDAKRELVNQSLDSTSRFFYDVINGDVPDLALKPALSLDFYDAYRIWCARSGVRCAPINRLLNVLQRRHKVRIERKRYATLTGVAGPHSIVMLTFDECPPGASESDWLGDQVTAFRESLKAYKGAAHA